MNRSVFMFVRTVMGLVLLGLMTLNPVAYGQAISGNICRCGTYPKVVEAALSAARSRKGA